MKLCQHPRNLNDEQLKALIKRNGNDRCHFCTAVSKNEKQANVADIVRHIEYICSLGGENNIGFGSMG